MAAKLMDGCIAVNAARKALTDEDEDDAGSESAAESVPAFPIYDLSLSIHAAVFLLLEVSN